MNYFELYELPVSFSPDKELVKKRFYALSKAFHPDFYSNETESEQDNALEQSADINKAYKIFTNTDETLKYVLQLNNLIEEEEKYKLDNSFLMDVMELNEQLMDAKMEVDTAQVQSISDAIHELQNTIYEMVRPIIEQDAIASVSEKELLQVKDYYYKKKYLNRILSNIE